MSKKLFSILILLSLSVSPTFAQHKESDSAFLQSLGEIIEAKTQGLSSQDLRIVLATLDFEAFVQIENLLFQRCGDYQDRLVLRDSSQDFYLELSEAHFLKVLNHLDQKSRRHSPSQFNFWEPVFLYSLFLLSPK